MSAGGGDRPIALDAYEALADAFSEIAPRKAENAYVEQPAMREALGDVRGLDVLDAGCGPGILAAYLQERGARVAGVDVSPRMVALARARLGPEADVRIADLARPLDGFADASFDAIASSLALDYVRDWSGPLREFHRLLRPGGRLLVTVQHPLGSWLWFQPPTAFGVQQVEIPWRGFGEPVVVPDHYRSLEEIVNPFLASGLRLERVQETRPVPALREIDPARYEKYSRRPTFLLLQAARP